jgi:phosphoglycolate phosphatase
MYIRRTTPAVLLVLEGTITDPARGIFNSVVHALDRLGKDPLGPRELRSFIGPPLSQSFARNGIPCVGVAWGYAEPGELAAAGAHLVVEHLADVPAAIVDART